jgi:hypothetical protein
MRTDELDTMTSEELVAALFDTKEEATAYVEDINMHYLHEFAKAISSDYRKGIRKLKKSSKAK